MLMQRWRSSFATTSARCKITCDVRAQREVVLLMCQGKSNKEIAALRNVGEQTIKNMLTKHIFRAFGVTSRAALVSLCLRRTPLMGRSDLPASS